MAPGSLKTDGFADLSSFRFLIPLENASYITNATTVLFSSWKMAIVALRVKVLWS